MKKLFILVIFFISCNNRNEEIPEIKIVTNRDYFPTIRDVIRTSREYIYFTMFVAKIEGYNQVSMLLYELISAKEKGITIKVLLDSSSYDDELNRSNSIFADSLRKYGIEVKFDSPDTTTHAKFGIFDGKIVLIGSTNWTYSSLERNNEVNILIKDKEIAEELKIYFEKLWGKDD
uniref:phospholipase D n=1 Tax=candidate division WOR-3 bacterium TaxID=2052148 RepID=A0A7C4U9F5_UNCW3